MFPAAPWIAARAKRLGDTEGPGVPEGEEVPGVFWGVFSRDFVFSAIVRAPYSRLVRSALDIA